MDFFVKFFVFITEVLMFAVGFATVMMWVDYIIDPEDDYKFHLWAKKVKFVFIAPFVGLFCMIFPILDHVVVFTLKFIEQW